MSECIAGAHGATSATRGRSATHIAGDARVQLLQRLLPNLRERERERKEDYGKESWLMGQCVLLHLVRQTRIHVEQVELVGQHRSH